MRTDLVTVIAGGLLLLEALGIAALTFVQLLAVLGGDTAELATAIALLVLTAIGAVAVAAFGIAALRDRSWGRSGGIVTQLLILAVAIGAATGSYAHPLLGLQLSIPAVVTLVVLVTAVRRAGARRPTDADD